ncbi:MAG: hypothetical protein GTN62_07030 [Gemmatimonadales bacterium]|nr:hypothetical protein [Gemmatimonadales bacterium]NIN11253.1 hypothetical protein [Gemmatimonadales bacterium]NIN49852.1 hypothetical protein [Gemmatimonadales bacterium]NIP07316.1 hypothetical protein [Gemmatimonadales bacterium]NIR03011.1 hypothetical protein [Gemmatimonadales bacterium]
MADSKRWAVLVAGTYLAVVIFFLVAGFSVKDAFAFLPVVLLTVPWSFVATFALDAVAPRLLDNPFVTVAVLGAAAVLNALILFKLVTSASLRKRFFTSLELVLRRFFGPTERP